MYVRMLISMCVGLYTSRIVLASLGVVDYGINNVVGGIIAMFGFINGSMSNTTSRYITFYLKSGNHEKLNNIFNLASFIHFIIAFGIVLLGETIGLWFLHTKMTIPEDRMFAAEWLYQLSILTAVVSIISVPYNATIIAHERMNTFAYISIIDVFLKLLIAFSISYVPFDKLIYYGTLIFVVQVVDRYIYGYYCKKHFPETTMRFYWNKTLFKEMSKFAGWSLFGNFAYVFYTHGLNLLINIFCGPSVNAARGIAVQVDGVIKNFASNVQTAINPQIIKTYSEGEMARMYSLIFASSRICFFLLLVLSLPILFETDIILKAWLGSVPPHTVNFIRITLVNVILDTLINPMFIANLASGKVKIYQLTISSISYSFIIITYLAIKYTNCPETVFLCTLVSTIIGIGARIWLLHKQIGLPAYMYIQNVLLKIIYVVLAAIIIPLFIYCNMSPCLSRLLLVTIASFISCILFGWYWGLCNSERNMILKYVNRIFPFYVCKK